MYADSKHCFLCFSVYSDLAAYFLSCLMGRSLATLSLQCILGFDIFSQLFITGIGPFWFSFLVGWMVNDLLSEWLIKKIIRYICCGSRSTFLLANKGFPSTCPSTYYFLSCNCYLIGFSLSSYSKSANHSRFRSEFLWICSWIHSRREQCKSLLVSRIAL